MGETRRCIEAWLVARSDGGNFFVTEDSLHGRLVIGARVGLGAGPGLVWWSLRN